MTASSSAIPAATLVVFRRAAVGGPPELLMLERSEQMRFVPGATVFPGGRIDPADHVLARELSPAAEHDPADWDLAARIAAIRETLEETGLVIGVRQTVTPLEAGAARAMLLSHGVLAPVLAEFGWELDLARLVPFARWCPHWHGAFDTRFFIADLGTGAVEVSPDETENTKLFWASAEHTLALACKGRAHVIFPTARNLERLALHRDFAAAAAHAASHPVDIITPWEEEREGVPHLVIPEGLGYPVTGEPLATVQRS